MTHKINPLPKPVDYKPLKPGVPQRERIFNSTKKVMYSGCAIGIAALGLAMFSAMLLGFLNDLGVINRSSIIHAVPSLLIAVFLLSFLVFILFALLRIGVIWIYYRQYSLLSLVGAAILYGVIQMTFALAVPLLGVLLILIILGCIVMDGITFDPKTYVTELKSIDRRREMKRLQKVAERNETNHEKEK